MMVLSDRHSATDSAACVRAAVTMMVNAKNQDVVRVGLLSLGAPLHPGAECTASIAPPPRLLAVVASS